MEYVIELSEDKHELIKMAAAGGIGDWVYRIVAKGKPLEQTPRKGHWIATGAYYTGAYGSIDYVECSCCHYESLEEGDFCPNCGAKMDKE